MESRVILKQPVTNTTTGTAYLPGEYSRSELPDFVFTIEGLTEEITKVETVVVTAKTALPTPVKKLQKDSE